MVLEAPPAIQPSSALLLALPTEILLLIISNARSVDQLFLALTCKHMLVTSSMAAIMIPSAPKHRASRLSCSAMLAILRVVQPRGARGRPLKTLAPCCVCYRYRPKKKGYWKGIGKRYREEHSYGILGDYDYVVDSWSHRLSCSYECPECWCEERVRTYGHLKPKAANTN
ncbi:hypothetical protein C2857_006682 [Epichloe festucae Fl1]|uniref:F-box domain-containing protein n=1 Tax=Epichloe festucae (strain Fl1) TaxID=877507 RepID=A0A7S9KTN1_EPIFF|nr:hypothetical protein C2857_006682 [Epichloe festucae Fl1]